MNVAPRDPGSGGPVTAPATPAVGGELGVLVGNFARVLGAELALICRPGADGRAQVIASFGLDRPLAIRLPRPTVGPRVGRRPSPTGGRGSFIGRVLVHGHPSLEALDPNRDAQLTASTHTPLTHALSVPVRIPGAGAGALVAGLCAHPGDIEGAFGVAQSYAVLLRLLADHPTAFRGLLEHPRHDGLTGCLTYESTRQELVREIHRSERAGLRLSCLFIDLDPFRRINHRHGYLHGNEVLVEIARVLRRGVRRCDIVGRVRGDEFVAILPDTTESDAQALAERLGSLITARHAARFGETLTASIRVQEWSAGTSAAQLLTPSDRSLAAASALDMGATTQRTPGSASLELVPRELSVDEDQLKPTWTRAVGAERIAPVGRCTAVGEVMYSLVADRG